MSDHAVPPSTRILLGQLNHLKPPPMFPSTATPAPRPCPYCLSVGSHLPMLSVFRVETTLSPHPKIPLQLSLQPSRLSPLNEVFLPGFSKWYWIIISSTVLVICSYSRLLSPCHHQPPQAISRPETRQEGVEFSQLISIPTSFHLFRH